MNVGPALRRFVLGLLIGCTASAQSVQSEITARLLNRPLYLRQQYRENSLSFGPSGELRSPARPGPWTLAAVDIRRVRLTPETLILDGLRRGVDLTGRTPARVIIPAQPNPQNSMDNGGSTMHDGTRPPLEDSRYNTNGALGREQLHIEIARPPGDDFGPALSRIFADGLSDLTAALPPYWQRYARAHFSEPPQIMAEDPTPTAGGAISAAVPGKMPREVYTDAARYRHFGGNVLVSFHVETDGKVSHLEVIKAVGLGLDEEALVRLQQTRFTPAMQAGAPIVTQMRLNIPFRLD